MKLLKQKKRHNKNYNNVHHWLGYNLNRKNKCEFCKIQTKTEFALKKDCKYEKNENNYLHLCIKCHRNYDFTEKDRERLKKISLLSDRSKKRKPVKIIYPNKIEISESIDKAIKKSGVNKNSVYKCLNKSLFSCKGIRFEYL